MNERIDWDRLWAAAREAQSHAYAPYSGVHVGAAVLDADGRVFAGANVENASFGLTICAERVAAAAAVSAGSRRFLLAVVVADTPDPPLPCGACRQFLAEFATGLVAAEGVGGQVTVPLAELLPHAFAADQLPPDRARAPGRRKRPASGGGQAG